MTRRAEIRLRCSLLRPWRPQDTEAFDRYVNDPEVARNLLSPRPCEAARALPAPWRSAPALNFALECEGEAAGGIGVTRDSEASQGFLSPPKDLDRRGAYIGYWLARRFWNRGIMSEAVHAVTEHAFAELGLVRMRAAVFPWNVASMRVLEKCSYARDGAEVGTVMKDWQLVDCVVYVRRRPDVRRTSGT